MEPHVLAVDDLRFPVLLLHGRGWVHWPDAEALMSDWRLRELRAPDQTILRRPGVLAWLVDATGAMYDIAEVEDLRVDISRLRRAERRRAVESGQAFGPLRFVCAGPPRSVTIDQVRERIAWTVSARGHFENPNGFGLSAEFGSAYSFPDLFEALPPDAWWP